MKKKPKHPSKKLSPVDQSDGNASQTIEPEVGECQVHEADEELLAKPDGQQTLTESFVAEILEEAQAESATDSEREDQSLSGAQLELVDGESIETPSDELDAQTNHEKLKLVLESLIFVADKPVTPIQLSKVVRRRQPEVRALLGELAQEYKSRGIELVEIGGGYTFRSASTSAAYVREFLSSKPVRLSRAQLETLAIVAYRQPVTRPEIEDVRGVDTGSAVKVLLERGLIKMLGRKDEPGRPLLYGTTPYFLEFFGLKGLADLPTLREFSDLTEESRNLFQRKTGESLEGVQVAPAAWSGAESEQEEPSEIGQDEENSIGLENETKRQEGGNEAQDDDATGSNFGGALDNENDEEDASSVEDEEKNESDFDEAVETPELVVELAADDESDPGT